MWPPREDLSEQEIFDYVASSDLNHHIPEWQRLEATVHSETDTDMYENLLDLSLRGMNKAITEMRTMNSVTTDNPKSILIVCHDEQSQQEISIFRKFGEFINQYQVYTGKRYCYGWTSLILGLFPRSGK